MKFTNLPEAERPALVGRNGARVLPVTKDELRTAGTPFTGAGMGKGDIVEFFDEYDGVDDVRKVEVRANSNTWDYRICCLKNGKADWVSLGFFCRTDKDRQPVHPVSVELNKLHDHGERIDFLAGRTVIADESVEYLRQRFSPDGAVIDGEYETRISPLCIFKE